MIALKQETRKAARRGLTLVELLVVAALLFFGALFWANGLDPFQRIWFTVQAPGQGKAECMALVPKGSLKPNRPSPDFRHRPTTARQVGPARVQSRVAGGGRWWCISTARAGACSGTATSCGNWPRWASQRSKWSMSRKRRTEDGRRKPAVRSQRAGGVRDSSRLRC